MKTLHFFKSWSKALHVFLLMLLTAPLAVSAQETLTVYPDGTQTSTDVPICDFVATQLKCEFVIPASELGVMEEGTISKMTFHLSGTASGLENHTFQVFLREVDNPTISSYYGTTGATIVYEGSLSASQSTMDVTFTTNYTYHGGNLLVGVYKPGGILSSASGMKFWGKTVSGACVQGDAFSEYESVTCTQKDFIPRATFTYTGGNNTCPRPKNLAVSNVSDGSATLSWTQSGDVDHWDVFYTDNPNYEPTANTHPQFANISTNPLTLSGLPTGRTYYVYVRANCGDEVGDWSSSCVFLMAESITLNDGPDNGPLTPVPGNYVNRSFSSQFILPASDLQGMVNAEIRQLTFYTSSPANINWGNVVTYVRMKEVDATEMNTSYSFTTSETVYFSGYLSVVNNKMVVTLSEPYLYEGGNLLVYFQSYGNSSATTAQTNWIGANVENTSGYGSSYYNFRTSSSNYSGISHFLPKTTIQYVFPDCIKPTDLQASDITTNGATLSWTALGSGQTGWELQYRKADEADYVAVEGTVTNPYTLQGLEPSHGYVARLRAVCGNDSYSDWVETQFYTGCTSITLPYSYGFEDVADEGFPPCWSSYSTIEGYPFVFLETYGAEAHSGTHSLYFYGYGDEYTVMAVLPQIPVDAQHPMSGNEMVFYAAGYYDPTSCQVGIMTDPTDPETFELVETVEIPNAWYSGVGFLRYRVSFDGYTGNGTYIAIRKVKVDGEDAKLYVDDIEVRPIYNCSEPTGLTVTATTSSTVTLQWTANNDEIQWQVQYKLYDEEAWPETYQTVNQNPCTLEGLTPGKKYQARVRAVCSDTETSDWTDYAGFITAHAVPYYEDFGSSFEFFHPLIGWQWALGFTLEEILGGSNLEAGNGGGWQTSSLQSVTNPENGMSYSTEAFADTYINTDYDWFLSPNIELGEGYQLSFDLALDYNHSATSGLDDNRFAVVISEDGGNSWSLLALWDNDATQGRAYYDIPAILSEVNLDLSAYDNKIVRFAFYAESTVWNSGTNRLMIDNINVTKCIRPEMIVASDITTNSAVLDWTTHGETSWTLQYRIDGLGEWTTVSGITAHPYTLEGLVDPNSYQVRVKAHSAAGNSEWSNIAIFATDCASINLGPNETYEQRFEGRTVPACWSSGTSIGNGWYFNYATYDYDEQGNLIYCAYAHNSSGTTIANLIMPEVEVTPGLTLTFHHSTSTSADITVFFDLPSLERVVLWSSETDDLSAGVTTILLNDYVGQTIQIYFNFYATTSTYFYLYDVTLADHNTFTKHTENGYWTETANWSKGVLPEADEMAIVDGAAVIPNGCVAQADEIFLTSNGSLTLADGGQLKHNNAGVKATTQKSIMPYTIAGSNGEDKANGWYLIASPMEEAIEPTGSMLANSIDLYRFNQSAELEWENYYQCFYLSPYFKLFNGQGYLYANSGDGNNLSVMIDMEGQLRPAGEDVSVPLVYDANASLSGWNLVGNPFACDAYLAEPRDFYVMNTDGDELVVNESENGVIAPLQGIFVQAANASDNAVTFTSTQPETQGRGGALILNVYEGSVLRQAKGSQPAIDRAKVRFGDGPNLSKFSLQSDGTKMFITRDRHDYAVVHADKQGEVPVNFKAAQNGSYTLTVNPENAEMSYLHLIDNLTGADVDLLTEPGYTFDAKTTDYESRFRLVFSAICEDANGDNETFAFISNGNIIVTGDITGATLQVIDVMGRVIVSTDAVRNFSTNGMQAGVYVLRLINGDDVKTQKIVIDK